MNKPKLFKNENVNANNNLEYTTLKNIEENNNEVEEVLNSIFNSFNSIYNTKVEIVLEDRIIYTRIISRTRNNIMTINREIIPIKDIISITKK